MRKITYMVQWDVLGQVKALRKSPLLAPLRGARTLRSLQARIASPCWDGRLRAGPEHRWGSLCGGERCWRREERDSDSHFPFNSSASCSQGGRRATVVRPLRLIRLSRPTLRKRGSLGESGELTGRVCSAQSSTIHAFGLHIMTGPTNGTTFFLQDSI